MRAVTGDDIGDGEHHVLAVAASEAAVIAPSPLEGEGYSFLSARSDWVRGSLRKRASYEDNPSPSRASWNDLLALSLKGRGHINARPNANA
jgi:hypothetical protein